MPKPFWQVLMLFTLGLGCTRFAKADDCAADFTASGTAETGLHFEAASIVPALEAGKAIAQLKQNGASDGFLLGAEGGESGRRTLILRQQPKAGVRGFDIHLEVDQASQRVSVSTDLPAGMRVDRKVMQGALCGMVARLDMSKAEVSTAAGTASVAPAPEPQGSPWELCELNFRSSLASDIGRAFTSWAPMSNVDVDAATERLKTLSEQAGMAVDPPYRHGTEVELTIYRKAEADLAGFPIHIIMEEGLSVISAASRTERGAELSGSAMKRLMCGLVGAATLSEPPEEENPKKKSRSRFYNPFANQAKQILKAQAQAAEEEAQHEKKVDDAWTAALDRLVQQATISGKSVVIIPTLNLDAKYTIDALKEHRWDFRADRTSTTIWQNADDPGSLIRVGNDEGFEEVGLRGFLAARTSGMTRYLVYVANPGTYSVVGTTYEAPTATMPQLGSEQPVGRSPLGLVSLTPVRNTDYYQTQEWADARYSDRQVTDNYCSAIYVYQGGACASWNTSTYTVTEMTSPAGWQNVTKSRAIDGLVVSTQIKAPFASFHVGASEVVLVDGFYAVPPHVDYNQQACAAVDGKQLQCDLTALTLTRIPARLADLEKFGSSGLVQLQKSLERAKYERGKLSAQPGKLNGTLGQDYLIRSP